jgi:hypothetical protein
MEFKLKKELKLGEETIFQFGIPDSGAIESWSRGIELMDDWSYLDSDELNSFIMKLMKKNSAVRKVQWTVHYQLNKNP